MKIMINKCDIYALIICLFPICNLFGEKLGYFDEIIGAISLVYILLLFITKQLNTICKKITIAMIAITIIGIISNIMSGLISDYFAVFVDLLWLWKTFAVFIFFYKISEHGDVSKRVISLLSYPAKFVIILMFVTAIFSQFVDIGVSGIDRIYGLRPYNFFWGNGIQTGWLAFCSIIILAMSNIKDNTFYKYLIATIIPLLLTASSLVYCWIAVVLLLMFLMRKNEKFKYSYLIIIVLGVCLFTLVDIQTYFVNDISSVRKTLIEYGMKTANMYFPLGSGFATYGSDMATRNYSQLYISFGWEHSWALGRGSTFLNDNFFASIVAQFGWIGFALYLFALFQVFKAVNKNSVNKRSKILSIATVLTICAVMIGSASAKSMMGVCTFAVLGIVCGQGISTHNEYNILKGETNRNDKCNYSSI